MELDADPLPNTRLTGILQNVVNPPRRNPNSDPPSFISIPAPTPQQLTMSLAPCPAARELALPFCKRTFEIIENVNRYENPVSEFARDLVALKDNKKRAVVYGAYDENGHCYKVGQTTNAEERSTKYPPNHERRVEEDIDSQVRAQYAELMEAATNPDNNLEKGHRAIMEAIRWREGECLGPKSRLCLMMPEGGMQTNCACLAKWSS